MFAVMLNVLGPVLICIGIGFYWARKGTAYDTGFVSKLVMNVGAPCLIVSSITQINVSVQALLKVSGVALAVTLCMMLTGYIVTRLKNNDWRALMPPLAFPNTGNMGLPLSLFAFGEQGLVLAVAYFLPVTVVHMSAGLFIVGPSSGSTLSRVFHTMRQPIFVASIMACVMLATEMRLPLWLNNAVDLLAGITIPLMLITLGVSLATLRSSDWLQSSLYSALRIGGGLMLALILANLFGLTGTSKQVAVLQSMMPAAVFNYLLAVQYDRRPDLVAGVVVASTVMIFIVLPFVLPLLMSWA